MTAPVQSVAALLRRVQGQAGGLYPPDLPLGLTWGSSGAEDTGLEHEPVAQGPRGLVLSPQRGWHPTEPTRSSAAYGRSYARYKSGLLFLMLFFIGEIAVSDLCFRTCLLTEHGQGWILSWCKAALAHQLTASPHLVFAPLAAVARRSGPEEMYDRGPRLWLGRGSPLGAGWPQVCPQGLASAFWEVERDVFGQLEPEPGWVCSAEVSWVCTGLVLV